MSNVYKIQFPLMNEPLDYQLSRRIEGLNRYGWDISQIVDAMQDPKQGSMLTRHIENMISYFGRKTIADYLKIIYNIKLKKVG